MATDLKHKSAEELMEIYQCQSPNIAFAAFSELYLRFSQKVYAYLISKVKNVEDAEDLMQKIFIKIHESKHLYKNKFRVEQWIFVIARTTVLDFYRSSARYKGRIEKNIFSEPIRTYEDNENILPLEKDQRDLLEMKYIDELSYQEIARVLQKSETSLRKIVSRLVLNLKNGAV